MTLEKNSNQSAQVKSSAQKRSQRSRASERASARRSASLRLTRTILLGTVAMGFGVLWVAEEYGVERDVVLEFMSTSALFVGLLVAAGLVGAGLLFIVRMGYSRYSKQRGAVADVEDDSASRNDSRTDE